uniref:ATP synthase F0 subunit 6 n=1 Tax=Ichthyoxenos japonensis TaxID=2033261 RepID=UPI000EF349A8|nr:ATP synthase F0 subunit 6 [Ichthyoxenos japonensis]ATO58523.1 ATP synthase F0 subunit 6 [Ichthyoxenos japonensis]
MTNLFSIFDPSSSIMNFHLNWNWISSWIGFTILPFYFWTSNSRYLMLNNLLINLMTKEFSNIFNPKNKPIILYMTSLFIFILLNNMLGLLPFVFTASTHLSFTLTMALTMWIGYFIFKIISNPIHYLAHMVPQQTPILLLPFMVLIETLSNLIRPFTLAIRLFANMVAGHLLLALMSSSLTILNPLTNITIILLQILLMILETAVSFIQAYVFTMLCTLYIQEDYDKFITPLPFS